ncbi:MAG: beta-lactamase family protein [Proteobacteria bacterium]|nr:beta-lactamase family protein [Pseudomonadota bacterium]
MESNTKWNRVREIMEEGVTAKVFPGGILHVIKSGRTLFKECFGVRDYVSMDQVSLDTVYDLASLTKPCATTLALMKLIDEKKIELDKPISEYIEGLEDKKGKVLISQLLDHTSGLPAHREYFNDLLKIDLVKRKEKLRDLLVDEKLIAKSGTTLLYSDLGFMLLELIVEKISGASLEHITSQIFKSLNIDSLFYTGMKPDINRYKFAKTEDCSYRGLLEGLVHDDNCYAVGGICGHAGLFGTIDGLSELLKVISYSYKYAENSFVKNDLIKTFLTKQGVFEKPLGFDSPDGENSGSGRLFSKNSVGHLGFTGTSFWIDLERDIIVILLTNRVHPTRENIKIRKFRPLIHDTIMSVILGETLINK